MKHLGEIVNSFSDKRIVVIGDVIADQFIYGEISRVSREAPVFILRHEHTETTPGGAGNCAMNLAALGANVNLISIIGGDVAGRMVHEEFKGAGIQFTGILASEDTQTATKTRILAGQLHSTRQQVIRIDYEATKSHHVISRALLLEQTFKGIKESDAVIISDYDEDIVDDDLASMVRNAAEDVNIPVIVDSRHRLSSFTDFTSGTPNEDEVEQLLGATFNDAIALETAAEQLRRQLRYQALLVTRGSLGMMLLEEGEEPLHIEAVGSQYPVDVTGAGDTVIATYTLALSAGASFAEAARLANLAGGIVVSKRGTSTVSVDEILSSIAQGSNA